MFSQVHIISGAIQGFINSSTPQLSIQMCRKLYAFVYALSSYLSAETVQYQSLMALRRASG